MQAAGAGDNTPPLQKVLREKDTKEYNDFRDRAAYTYITGTFPSHLRKFATALLRMASRYSRSPVSLDGLSGSMKLDDEVIQSLDLENHPMVREVRKYLARGYHVQVSRDLTARKPYSKVFLYKTEAGRTDRVTVQIDGFTREGW